MLKLLMLCVLFLAELPFSAAQVADGVIEIVAMDSSGAALPGVSVTISRSETGFERTVVTDATGFARAFGIPPGS